jgi:hypothetical protein
VSAFFESERYVGTNVPRASRHQNGGHASLLQGVSTPVSADA